jgi:hypothetical protein
MNKYVFITLSVIFLQSLAQAKDSAKMYECYKSLAVTSIEPILIDDRFSGIESVSDTEFHIVSAQGIRTCKVDKKSLPIKVTSRGKTVLINYAVDTLSLAPASAQNLNSAQPALCINSKDVSWLSVVERRINDLRQECDDPDKRGMSTAPTCLAEYITALKVCQQVPEWKVIMSEYIRSGIASQKNRRAAGEALEVSSPVVEK